MSGASPVAAGGRQQQGTAGAPDPEHPAGGRGLLRPRRPDPDRAGARPGRAAVGRPAHRQRPDLHLHRGRQDDPADQRPRPGRLLLLLPGREARDLDLHAGQHGHAARQLVRSEGLPARRGALHLRPLRQERRAAHPQQVVRRGGHGVAERRMDRVDAGDRRQREPLAHARGRDRRAADHLHRRTGSPARRSTCPTTTRSSSRPGARASSARSRRRR